jgi:hypothetical protein
MSQMSPLTNVKDHLQMLLESDVLDQTDQTRNPREIEQTRKSSLKSRTKHQKPRLDDIDLPPRVKSLENYEIS